MSSLDGLSRKEFVTSLLLMAVGTAIPSMGSAAVPPSEITVDDLKAYEKIAGISFTDEERKSILDDIRQARTAFNAVRELPIEFTTEPRYIFTPIGGGSHTKFRVSVKVVAKPPKRATLSEEDIAFSSVAELGALIRRGELTSLELTKLYIARLKKYGEPLLCLVTLIEDAALKEAAAADEELRSGHDRGPLHGIPYGIKDLFATKGVPTTWGANNFENRVIELDATVVKKLREAGAILVAKLSMGALAQGDVWFKGTTKNPWNMKQGSSGSSAGSSSATAAGLVAFAIGTETLGSIVSPSTRCRLFGLRPTYGRISRYGGMALSYSMDKAGPICRYASDTALVLAAICGADPQDPSAVNRDFVYPAKVDFHKLKIGVLVPKSGIKNPIKMDPFLTHLQQLGAQLKPVAFSSAPNALYEILNVESGSAFDAFTRGEEVRNLKDSAWPETFRASRFVSAVDYIQAQRARTLLMNQFEQEFGDLDMYVTGNGGGYTLAHTNWTGHPQIVIPQGDDGAGNSTARTLVGRLYEEAKLIAVASQCLSLDYHKSRPKL